MFWKGVIVNSTKNGLRQRTYYYVQPADQKTNNLIKTALPEKPVTRSAEEAIGAPVRSSHPLYRVEWKDVEVFMQISYLSFNVFMRKEKETLPRFMMRKSPEIEKRNLKAIRPDNRTLILVKNTKPQIQKEKVAASATEKPKKCFAENPELARKNAERLNTVPRPKKAKIKLLVQKKTKPAPKREIKKQPLTAKKEWATYVIVSLDEDTTHTMTHIWKALTEYGLNTLSLHESGEFREEYLDRVWEANGDVLFRLWRYAQKDSKIMFMAFRTTNDGIFENFEPVLRCPKSETWGETKGKLLHYQTNKV
jgi:hypothetical protein